MQRASVVVCLLLLSCFALAQVTPAPASNPANPYSAYTKTMYLGIQKILLRSAEKMPAEHYGYKPTDAVRSYGQILGHVADAQYLFCSKALGETNPAPKVEETKHTKAELIAALKDAFQYCDRAYSGMTDAAGAKPVKLFGEDAPALGTLIVNNTHTMEHYGNLVTYLRMNGIVPPTSENNGPPPAPSGTAKAPEKK